MAAPTSRYGAPSRPKLPPDHATHALVARLREMKDLSTIDALREMIVDACKDKDSPVPKEKMLATSHLIDDL